MTSKEALEKLLNDIYGQGNVLIKNPNLIVTVNVNLEMFATTIENALKDLERKDQLEKENEKLSIENDELLDNKLELVVKNKQQDIFIEKLIQANEKLEKVVKLFKYKIILVDILRDCDNVEEYNEFGLSNLSQQEYELLKEVLENEKN